MEKEGFEFDLVTQRFIKNRWETELGQKVLAGIIEGLKKGVDVRGILDGYVLDHPENQHPYEHPYYPKDSMKEDSFWVLTQDDLRGVHIHDETFPKHTDLGKKSLNYSRFHNCSFEGANLEMTSLTAAVFNKCNLRDACIAISGGYHTCFIDCDMRNVCLTQAHLEDTDFSGSNLSGAYFELAKLIDIKVNYLTIFDEELNKHWSTRVMPENEQPEILKSIRVAYEKAEIWQKADRYLYLERLKNRKSILWEIAKTNKSISSITQWVIDWIWCFSTGYGVKPSRILVANLTVALIFAIIYFIFGNPGPDQNFATSLYFSLTSFTTLGYGDIVYAKDQWIMRLICSAEAFCGASLVSIFVAVMSRKLLRY